MTGPGQSVGLMVGLGTMAAMGTSGPLMEVLNEMALVLAVMGAAGGVTRGLAIKLPWREVFRGAALGALMAFGFGALSPTLIAKLFSIQIGEGASVPFLAASAYVLGFGQDVVISFMQKRSGPDA